MGPRPHAAHEDRSAKFCVVKRTERPPGGALRPLRPRCGEFTDGVYVGAGLELRTAMAGGGSRGPGADADELAEQLAHSWQDALQRIEGVQSQHRGAGSCLRRSKAGLSLAGWKALVAGDQRWHRAVGALPLGGLEPLCLSRTMPLAQMKSSGAPDIVAQRASAVRRRRAPTRGGATRPARGANSPGAGRVVECKTHGTEVGKEVEEIPRTILRRAEWPKEKQSPSEGPHEPALGSVRRRVHAALILLPRDNPRGESAAVDRPMSGCWCQPGEHPRVAPGNALSLLRKEVHAAGLALHSLCPCRRS